MKHYSLLIQLYFQGHTACINDASLNMPCIPYNQLIFFRKPFSYLFLQEWQDELLQWEPANHSDIEFLVMPAHQIWLPDIYVANR